MNFFAFCLNIRLRFSLNLKKKKKKKYSMNRMTYIHTSLISSSFINRMISAFALLMASSFVASMAKYSLRSPSFGSLPGGKYEPLTVIPASEKSEMVAKASWILINTISLLFCYKTNTLNIVSFYGHAISCNCKTNLV